MDARKTSPLLNMGPTAERLDEWVEAQKNGKSTVNIFEPPTPEVLTSLERTRSISKELQASLSDLEKTIRIAEKENALMNPTAKIPEYVENHEYVSANLAAVYTDEDHTDGVEEERKILTQGNRGGEIGGFFARQCVLLTGGTGFLGKAIIEKLLRCCSDLDTIYVVVRAKKGLDPASRIQNMLSSVLFERAKRVNPGCLRKVVAISGDMAEPGLGISAVDRQMLITKVSVIINSAATVRFDERLSTATAINVRGARSLLVLARACRGLRALTHVSTAFAHCPHASIEERFYDPPLSVEMLESVASIDDKILDNITTQLLGDHPNTYCFTKAVSEDGIRKYGEGMPICIVRPGIVVSTYEEPLRGWTDNLYGPTGVMVGIGTGVLRTMYMDESKKADIVPVDYTVNAILAATWDTAKRFKDNQTSDIPIYNYVSSPQNPITWGRFIEINQKNGVGVPTMKAVWYYGMNMTSCYPLFLFYNFFLHFLPALLVDIYFTLVGKKRMMLSLYRKMFKLGDVLTYFAVRDWSFENGGVQALWGRLSATDRTLFPFDMGQMSWEYHSETLLAGLRVYIVKDDLSTLPEARKRWNRLYYMHQGLKAATWGLLASSVYLLLSATSKLLHSI